MLRVPKLEKDLGIEVYATQSKGIGGLIRFFFEDFVVEEILLDGSTAKTVVKDKLDVNQFLASRETWRNYLICVMIKRGWDSLLATRRIAQQLGIGFADVQIAGLKDKKALTAQHVSLKNVHPGKLEKVKLKDLTLIPLKYLHRPLSPHLLLGNYFNITIRAITPTENETKKRIRETWTQLKRLGGIPNFFGHQRFGTTRPITHKVGRALVKGDFEKAVLTFLAEVYPGELEDSRLARQKLLENQNYEEALKDFPTFLVYERLMLRHLVKHPKDFVGAFRKLPIRLRRLFVQAYQSYLFNKFLSSRMKRKIPLNKPEIGDLAIHIDKYGLPTPKHETVSEENITRIREAIKKEKMRIALPLPGYLQKLSEGIQGEIERNILEKEEISLENFHIQTTKEISSKGKLRPCLAPIKDFSLTHVGEDPTNPSKRQATLKFMLLRGSYATVVLREFMKPRNIVDAGF